MQSATVRHPNTLQRMCQRARSSSFKHLRAPKPGQKRPHFSKYPRSRWSFSPHFVRSDPPEQLCRMRAGWTRQASPRCTIPWGTSLQRHNLLWRRPLSSERERGGKVRRVMHDLENVKNRPCSRMRFKRTRLHFMRNGLNIRSPIAQVCATPSWTPRGSPRQAPPRGMFHVERWWVVPRDLSRGRHEGGPWRPPPLGAPRIHIGPPLTHPFGTYLLRCRSSRLDRRR